jgi:hypothetical protein
MEINDANHLLEVRKKLDDTVVPTMLKWMRKQLQQK